MSGIRSDDGRQRGRIEERGKTLRVIVYAGVDPVTGKRVYLRETINGTDAAAYKRARRALNKLLTQVDSQRSAPSSVSLSHALDEWMRTSEIEDSTRQTYQGYIDRTIHPVLGDEPVNKITARMLENFYADLRRCRARCDGKPFIEKHTKRGDHDCRAAKCKAHACKPMAASTVRQIHAILSGTLDAAERWDWINSNPARVARKPRQKAPEPDPPTPQEAARLSEEAFRVDDDWGTLVWLAMTTGLRRGELVGLRFSRLDLDNEVIDLRRNWVGGKEKDTKTHQHRRIALDTETVVLLKEHKERVRQRVEALGVKLSEDLFVFSSRKTPDHSEPYSPNAVTQRYKDMAERLGVETHLHALRHYESWRRCYATSDVTWGVAVARACAIWCSNGVGASPSFALCRRVVL
jgi:integrase